MAFSKTKINLLIHEAMKKEQEEKENRDKQQAELDELKKKKEQEEKNKSIIMKHERFKKAQELKNKKEEQKEEIKESYIVDFLQNIVENVLSKKYLIEKENKKFIPAVIKDLVHESGGTDMLLKLIYFNTNSVFMHDSYKVLTESIALAEEFIDKVGYVDPEHKNILNKFKSLQNENIDNISDIIRDRVMDAIEDFLEYNSAQEIEMEDIVMDMKDKSDSIKSYTTPDREKLSEQFNYIAKRKINKLQNIPKPLYAHIVHEAVRDAVVNNISGLVLENGTPNIELIKDIATIRYTLLESLNSLNIIKFDRENIKKYIK